MITIFMTARSSSSRKAKAWLKEQNLSFVERNLYAEPLTYQDFKQILRLTEHGTADIIATRSCAFKKFKSRLNGNLSLRELFELVNHDPSLLRQPLITDGRLLQISFNDVDIRQFIPRKVRRLELSRAQLGLRIA